LRCYVTALATVLTPVFSLTQEQSTARLASAKVAAFGRFGRARFISLARLKPSPSFMYTFIYLLFYLTQVVIDH
jgi:hypothetical protein